MKIFIVGSESINKLEYANALIGINDNYNICRYLTSDKERDGMIGEYRFHMDIDDINIAFKNKALFFIDFNDDNITGITFDDYYASDIVCMNTYHFNMIPLYLLQEGEIIIVWIDSKSTEVNVHKELAELRYFNETIESIELPYLYFINEDKDFIAKVVIDYIESDEERRKEILEEHN